MINFIERYSIILFFIIITINANCESGDFQWDYENIIKEHQIPMPETYYKLPDILIGEFVMRSRGFDHRVIIFPNNKYISVSIIPNHPITFSYGHIILNNNTWYFSPITRLNGYINTLTKINLTDFGFSYELDETGVLFSMRKEDMPVIKNLAEEINIPNKNIKKQYYIFYNFELNIIEFNEIEKLPRNLSFSHNLQINNGIITITRVLNTGEEIIIFNGFIELINKNTDILKGNIFFTNGVPYSYISNGTAEIEINNNGSIIISMLYFPDPYYMSELAHTLEFPAKLVLEF